MIYLKWFKKFQLCDISNSKYGLSFIVALLINVNLFNGWISKNSRCWLVRALLFVEHVDVVLLLAFLLFDVNDFLVDGHVYDVWFGHGNRFRYRLVDRNRNFFGDVNRIRMWYRVRNWNWYRLRRSLMVNYYRTVLEAVSTAASTVSSATAAMNRYWHLQRWKMVFRRRLRQFIEMTSTFSVTLDSKIATLRHWRRALFWEMKRLKLTSLIYQQMWVALCKLWQLRFT